MKYVAYRNYGLFHLYRIRVTDSGKADISRTTYRLGTDRKYREVIDLQGFGCLCNSLEEALAYIESKESWKRVPLDWYNINTGKPYDLGVRNEFLSEDRYQNSIVKAGSEDRSGFVWRPEDFRPLHHYF